MPSLPFPNTNPIFRVSAGYKKEKEDRLISCGRIVGGACGRGIGGARNEVTPPFVVSRNELKL